LKEADPIKIVFAKYLKSWSLNVNFKHVFKNFWNVLFNCDMWWKTERSHKTWLFLLTVNFNSNNVRTALKSRGSVFGQQRPGNDFFKSLRPSIFFRNLIKKKNSRFQAKNWIDPKDDFTQKLCAWCSLLDWVLWRESRRRSNYSSFGNHHSETKYMSLLLFVISLWLEINACLTTLTTNQCIHHNINNESMQLHYNYIARIWCSRLSVWLVVYQK
jgi:hypothetical protein